MEEKNQTEKDLSHLVNQIQELDGWFMTSHYEIPFHKGKFGVFFLAVLQRCAQLCRSYQVLVKANQYTTAAAVIRMQLDNALRTYALLLADNRENFALDFFSGKKISETKTKQGEKLHDGFLKRELEKVLPGVEALYNQTSGYIHLSHLHHHHHTKVVGDKWEDLKIQIALSGVDDISIEKKMELTAQMVQASGFAWNSLLITYTICNW